MASCSLSIIVFFSEIGDSLRTIAILQIKYYFKVRIKIPETCVIETWFYAEYGHPLSLGEEAGY